MDQTATTQRSRVPWALAVIVGLCSGLAGYVIHAARVNRAPKQVVTVKRLTDMPGAEESPAISPDGTKVAFVAAVGEKKQIWIEQPITKDDVDHFAPRWMPDSKSVIYFANSAIWEIPATGGEARKLADAIAPGGLSRDGKLAYFRRGGDGVELTVDSRVIAKLIGSGAYSNLRWSPDEKKIAYQQEHQVMVVDSAGGEPTRATDITSQGFAWTPDNSGLIVSTHGELWFVPRVENRSPSQLTFGELSYESPDINPAGTLVVSRRGLSGQTSDTDIVMFKGLKW